ncbi:hypothetical protein SAMN04487825_101227 [Prevotella sp. kh1p2]|nr:hypothetical protein SAMN04487825_101227 [Prevotella sp. kh1p2]SNU10027.1 hypothetical protein SAMN06298210_10158 [Prevotellaceae bacterium KH2P17]
MRMKGILIMMFALPLIFLSACSDDDADEISSLKQDLIGTWKWEANYGGDIIWKTEPLEGQERLVTFTKDSVKITDNVVKLPNGKSGVADTIVILQNGSYTLARGQNKYFITIIPKDNDPNLNYLDGMSTISLDSTKQELSIGSIIEKPWTGSNSFRKITVKANL